MSTDVGLTAARRPLHAQCGRPHGERRVQGAVHEVGARRQYWTFQAVNQARSAAVQEIREGRRQISPFPPTVHHTFDGFRQRLPERQLLRREVEPVRRCPAPCANQEGYFAVVEIKFLYRGRLLPVVSEGRTGALPDLGFLVRVEAELVRRGPFGRRQRLRRLGSPDQSAKALRIVNQLLLFHFHPVKPPPPDRLCLPAVKFKQERQQLGDPALLTNRTGGPFFRQLPQHLLRQRPPPLQVGLRHRLVGPGHAAPRGSRRGSRPSPA